VEVAKAMKRTEAAVRQKAKTIGIGLGQLRAVTMMGSPKSGGSLSAFIQAGFELRLTAMGVGDADLTLTTR
jgi:hypothetical protein